MRKIYAFLFVLFISLPFFIEEVAAAIIDEAEPNDTSVNAQLIERNNHDPAQMINGNNASQKVLVGNLSSATDEDQYQVYLPANPETYLSINGQTGPIFKFEIFDATLGQIFEEDYSKDPSFIGAFPYEFNVSTAGIYYVKVSSVFGTGGDYRFTVGSPNYMVDSYEYTAATPLTLTTSINTAQGTYDLRHIADVPKKAIVYQVTFGGTKVNSATSEYRRIKLAADSSWINTSSYSWIANIPAVQNKAFHSQWSVQLQGKVSNSTKPYSLTPKLRFSYFYPIIP